MIPDQSVEPVSLSLSPYTGVWTTVQAAHLLRRCMFGPTYQQIQDAVSNGLNATVAQLLSTYTVSPPLTYDPGEAVSAFGTTWVNSVYPANSVATENARFASLAAWMMQRCNSQTVSIQEKLSLFWHNHFGVEAQSDARGCYNLHELYRSSCLGNFKQLVKDVTVDVQMLMFLNGASNNQYYPNENYAREVLELFTVGKGPQIGDGDYTNYTEDDVHAGAKIFTGWIIQDVLSQTATTPSSSYYAVLHDASVKTLSDHFGNATVANADAAEYSNYLDIVFQQPDMGKFICRKLYRWFVNYDLTQAVEDTVIADMCTTLEANNFEIQPVLDELFKSDHFYDVAMLGTIIKNPIEFLFSMLNASSSVPNFDLSTNYQMYLSAYYFGQVLGMEYLRPPSVGGWTAYYQQPSFSRLWANSSHIKSRFDFAGYMTAYTGIPVNGNNFKVDSLGLIDALSDPSNAAAVIADLALVFTAKGLSAAQQIGLKSILTGGQPDSEWTLQYTDYVNNPGDTTYSQPVRQRADFVLYRLFQMPEFQTI